MRRMRDVPEQDRHREKIAGKGVASLSDPKLIEAILGRGVKNRDVRELSREITVLIAKKPREIRYDDL